MATKLEKAVKREVWLRLTSTSQPKPVNVTLYPDGSIGFQPKGTRRRYIYPLSFVYEKAVQGGES